jgi:hypothetical protein
MERIRLGGEKWGRNELKISFQQFLLRPIQTCAENATYYQVHPYTRFARPDTCREVNLKIKDTSNLPCVCVNNV